MIGPDEFLQPVPLDPEHSDRFISGHGKQPLAFEEVLQNPRGEEKRRVLDKHEMRNFRWLYLVTGLLFIALIGRSGFLQIAQGERFRGLAEGNRVRRVVLTAPRGVLLDRNNEQLVENIPSYRLVMVPVDIPVDETGRKELFKKISKEFDVPTKELEETYQSHDVRSFDPVPIVEDVERDVALLLQTKSSEYPGIRADVGALRKYDEPLALSHVVGYVGKLTAEEAEEHPDYELTDIIGKSGLEQSLEEYVRGINGAQNVEVDALGQIVNVLATEQPTAGSDVVLGLDAGLQKKLYESLLAAATAGKKRAAAVAIDPRTGEVLAYVSIPGYDVNEFAKGIKPKRLEELFEDPNQPLFNRPISGTYSPGSTFKPFVATGALESGVIDTSTTFNDSGAITVGGQIFRGWKPGGHGVVDVFDAIANSVNGFFFSIGGGYGDIDGIGISGIGKFAKAFGFGEPTGIDLPGEQKGLIPTPEWKELNYNEPWYLGDTYNASIGQGFVLVTPLQLANATAAVANGGTLWWPHFAKSVLKADGSSSEIAPRVLNDNIASSSTINSVRQGMRQTVTAGTAKQLDSLPVQAAGKTGTAQFGGAGSKETHAWFTAFAPFDEPTIALAVLVEEAGEGSDFSVPVAREVLEYYFTR
jgi:penicillin-binding protein 2